MNPKPASPIPPPPGGEQREEPEFAHEDDIPEQDDQSEDGTLSTDPDSPRDVERE